MSITEEIYNKGFHIIDDFLDKTSFENLRKKAEQRLSQGDFRQAKIGKQRDANHHFDIRKDSICWLDEDENDTALCAYFSKIRELAKTLNRTLFLGLVDFETHFAVYQPGSFYKKHVDQFTNTLQRRISCVYYLNADWHESFAGQLKLYDCEDQLLTQVFPQPNRFICFRSELPHEVCETKKNRYSIAGWMKTRSL